MILFVNCAHQLCVEESQNSKNQHQQHVHMGQNTIYGDNDYAFIPKNQNIVWDFMSIFPARLDCLW